MADMVKELSKRFNTRYAKSFSSFNEKIIKLLDENGYDIPTISVSENGFSEECAGKSQETQNARVLTKTKKVHSFNVTYSIDIPWSDVEMTHNNLDYFNYYFDNVVQSALNNYFNKYGSVDNVRYGDYFITYIDSDGIIFHSDGSGDKLTLKFMGKWASSVEVV